MGGLIHILIGLLLFTAKNIKAHAVDISNLAHVSSQSVSTADASTEAAVFCNTHTKPRKASAAGPPQAQTL